MIVQKIIKKILVIRIEFMITIIEIIYLLNLNIDFLVKFYHT